MLEMENPTDIKNAKPGWIWRVGLFGIGRGGRDQESEMSETDRTAHLFLPASFQYCLQRAISQSG